MSKVNAYQVVKDRIIELMEQGTVPWRKPWTGGGEACNLISKWPYRGVDHLLWNTSGYACPYWATFNQIKKKGGKVKKGEKSAPAVFWKWYEREDPKSGEITEKPILRYYRVFNLEQTEGIELPKEESRKKSLSAP
jgi:antirestriction protein ArdC